MSPAGAPRCLRRGNDAMAERNHLNPFAPVSAIANERNGRQAQPVGDSAVNKPKSEREPPPGIDFDRDHEARLRFLKGEL
jgi:hypothetical protein